MSLSFQIPTKSRMLDKVPIVIGILFENGFGRAFMADAVSVSEFISSGSSFCEIAGMVVF